MNNLIIKNFDVQPYKITFDEMCSFTNNRDKITTDEMWFVEHPPVFTQGKVGKSEHLLTETTIPVVQSDRGGQITYHAIGQQIMYVLIDLKRRNITIRQLVSNLEHSVIRTLAEYDIMAHTKENAPGVYVDNKKICSLGLRIHRGCSMHGLALNVNMDLQPFKSINPCGYAGLEMTQMSDYVSNINQENVRNRLAHYFITQLPII